MTIKASTPAALVEFDGTTVKITRTGLGRQGRGVKTIPLSSIGAVQLRPPSPFRVTGNGVWSISVTGEVQSSEARWSRASAKDAAKHDENSVIIGTGHVKAFQALTDAINAAKAGDTPGSHPAPMGDVPAQLRQLGAMHHRGAIDDATFIRELHELLPRL